MKIAPRLLACSMERVSDRDQLDLFCRRHGDLLGDKVIVYKQLEHWTVTATHTVTGAA